MTTSGNGKSLALIILVVVLLLFAFRSIFYILPFGVFPGVAHSLRDAGHSWWRFPAFFPFALLPLAFMLLWVFVIVWVYRDAERRNMNGVLWALLVFFGNLIALLIYLIVRSDHPLSETSQASAPPASASAAPQTCPSCSKPVSVGYAYCPHCGAALRTVCPSCGKPVEKDWKACPYCGKKL